MRFEVGDRQEYCREMEPAILTVMHVRLSGSEAGCHVLTEANSFVGLLRSLGSHRERHRYNESDSAVDQSRHRYAPVALFAATMAKREKEFARVRGIHFGPCAARLNSKAELVIATQSTMMASLSWGIRRANIECFQPPLSQ